MYSQEEMTRFQSPVRLLMMIAETHAQPLTVEHEQSQSRSLELVTGVVHAATIPIVEPDEMHWWCWTVQEPCVSSHQALALQVHLHSVAVGFSRSSTQRV